jgi:ketosteroid isomerase-like protein
MRKSLLVLTLLAVLFVGHVARADDAADKAQLQEIEKRSAVALVNGDFQALGGIFAEEWTLVSDGQVMSRQQIFAQLKSGDLKFNSYDLGELDIRVFGDTAVVIGHGKPQGEYRGQKFEEAEMFTDTFVRIGGRWRCILSHSAPAP